ncbi:hypothetical protein, conserved [Plasmodium ovale wallikeri]|uniref:Uncharacterized protein n=2 Tax=Plasmodium ovale TaxID=36330 RepID=A0A1A8ZNI0_PLAOA|nr:hypothetical protein, conserved [Plasmodium ovale wallikeri]SBT57849.1 hypothetical protein, conserved [Plasmodium ovale wallikeri]SBT78876.1 conserved Plasmodium protein, unknown function [Plasmodium ovale]
MSLEIVEERMKKLEEELEKFREKELYKMEKIKNEITLLHIEVKEMGKKKNIKCLTNINKSYEKKITEKRGNCAKKKKYVKSIKKEILYELKIMKEEKKKNGNYLNRKFIFQNYIQDIGNEIKQVFLVLNVQRQCLFKSILEELQKLKYKSVAYFDKHVHVQKELDLLIHSINNNALMDIFVLTKNSQFFQSELAKMYRRFCRYVENSSTHSSASEQANC